jgi:hypothetical protein
MKITDIVKGKGKTLFTIKEGVLKSSIEKIEDTLS